MTGNVKSSAGRVIILPRAVRAEERLRAGLARFLLWSGKTSTKKRRYALTFGLPLLGVWLLVGTYALLAPRSYTSQMTLNLPGAGAQSSLNLEAIGQASSSAPSPFASASMSPKVIYKSIAESDRVRGIAAKALGVEFGEMPKPVISLIDETALITVKVSGSSPDEAQRRLGALHAALETQLDHLRRDEGDRRSAAIRSSLVDVEQNLKLARQALVNFQSSGEISSSAQFNGLTQSLETLNLKRAELAVERQRAAAEKEQLARVLGISPERAAIGLRVQSDPRFLSLLKEHADALSLKADASKKWGKKHPKVVAARNSASASRSAILALAESEFGATDAKVFDTLLLTDSEGRSGLFRALVEAEARVSGLTSQSGELGRQIEDLQQKLDRLAVSAARLADLERNHKIAEAVFSSALARVDTNRQDIYASYPLMQVVAEPSLPPVPSSPRIGMAVTGGALATIFFIIAMVLAWIRQPILRKILKSAPSGTPSP